MGCCEDIPIDGIYVPLHKRLVEYGKETYSTTLLKKYPLTMMWIFTFYKDGDVDACADCEAKFSKMIQWFSKYGLLTDPVKNVKWVVDDDIDNNLLLKDMHIEKTPVHLFCDAEGKIIDIIFGFPEKKWLEKYILPIVRNHS